MERAVFLIMANGCEEKRSNSGGSSAERRSGSGGGSQVGGSSGETSTDAGSYVGVAVFVGGSRAITVDHNLGDAAVGSSLHLYNPSERKGLQVRVAARSAEFDYAVLEYGGTYPHHLQLYTGSPGDLRGLRLALCAFQLGIQEEVPEFAISMGVMSAAGVKLSKREHHLIYTSETWPGDSGAALVMRDGQLVGLHVAGVNALCESFDRKCDLEERLSVVEESLEQAARSVATGCIALLSHTFADAL